mgnify:CR=1 FL=1
MPDNLGIFNILIVMPNLRNAKKALRQIKKVGFIVYFNTNPYFCRIRNNLIIFQSRAMGFSHDQKPIFESFIKENIK